MDWRKEKKPTGSGVGNVSRIDCTLMWANIHEIIIDIISICVYMNWCRDMFRKRLCLYNNPLISLFYLENIYWISSMRHQVLFIYFPFSCTKSYGSFLFVLSVLCLLMDVLLCHPEHTISLPWWMVLRCKYIFHLNEEKHFLSW